MFVLKLTNLWPTVSSFYPPRPPNLQQGSHIYQPTAWPVPHACAEPYHPGSGNQPFRPYWDSLAWHGRRTLCKGKAVFRGLLLPRRLLSTPLSTSSTQHMMELLAVRMHEVLARPSAWCMCAPCFKIVFLNATRKGKKSKQGFWGHTWESNWTLPAQKTAHTNQRCSNQCRLREIGLRSNFGLCACAKKQKAAFFTENFFSKIMLQSSFLAIPILTGQKPV